MSTESGDIPEAIMKEIRRRASQDWADDPDMLNDIIDAEIEAYRELQTMEADQVSTSVLEELKQSAKCEHPEDYSEQREYVVNGVTEYVYIQQVRGKIGGLYA